MRMSATKLVGVLAIGGALLASTACGPLDAVTGGGDKKAACENIANAARNLSSSSQPDLSNPGAGMAANAQKFSDFASTVRSEGGKAGGDVETAANAFASDVDKVANTFRQMGSNPSGALGGLNAVQDLQRSGKQLSDACGISGFRIGM